jgi:5-methyltetrahydropteroyltriglutamate--homocysteine methyltransferase
MARLYRADHVGSLLRPREVLEARQSLNQGRIGPQQLREVEDQAILDALELQRQVGLDVFTDGEFRRGDFRTDFADAVEGLTVDFSSPLPWHGPRVSEVEGIRAWYVSDRVRQVRRLTQEQSAFLRAHTPGPTKMTLLNAGYLGLRTYRPGVSDRVYPSLADLLTEVMPIVRNEIQALIDEGIDYVQLDAPGYTAFVDPDQRAQMRVAGIDPDQRFAELIATDEDSLQGIRRGEATLAMHLCRGNNQGHWLSQGGYDPIAERLFALSVDTFLLEYDTERAGSFEPLRFVPAGKHVVLGLISTKEGRLESQDKLCRRIDQAARYVPLDHLALSPQCGFASAAEGNPITPDQQRRKLELVVDTARQVWG